MRPRACALQQEKPLRWEVHTPELESSFHLPQLEKSLSSNEDPAQPNVNKQINYLKVNYFIWFLKLSRDLDRPTLTMVKSLLYGWVNWSCLIEMQRVGHDWESELNWTEWKATLELSCISIDSVWFYKSKWQRYMVYQSVVECSSYKKLTKWK